MTPSTWDFRNKLMAILNTAEHSGQAYVDVEAGNLHAELGGDPKANRRMPTYHEIMTRMMRPGDLILKEPHNDDRTTMLIRYLLKSKHDI